MCKAFSTTANRATLLAAALVLYAAGNLTPGERRGKQIYEQGTSARGTAITAVLASGKDAVPAGILPCAGCHGPEGLGKPEGGVSPSNITWDALTKPYGIQQVSGRKHPPYDERSLKRAITMGLDSAGNPLETTMPRFRMSLQDASDLVAYIRRLGDSTDPGLTETEIRIGVALEPADRVVWNQFFEKVNREGGVYGRHVQSVFLEPGVRSDPVFLLAISDPDTKPDPAIPSIIISEPFPNPTGNPSAFYLDSGLAGELDALCDWFMKRHQNRSAATTIMQDDSPVSRKLAERLRARLSAAGYPSPSDTSTSTTFWLSRETPILQRRGVRAEVLLPGTYATPTTLGLPLASSPRLIIASSGIQPFPPQRKGARTAVAAVLIAEALQRSGRQLSRAAFIDVLENLRGFETGILAPLTFDPNRHIGADAPRIFSVHPGGNRWNFELAL